MAIDRPDDIGQQFPSDATVLSLPDVHEGRAQIDYGTRPDTIETFPPIALASDLDDPNPVREFIVFADTDEFLIVREIFLNDEGNEIESDTLSFVAKPNELRKSTYDDILDSDNFLQTSLAPNFRSLVRTTDSNVFTRLEEVFPDYTVGSRIFAIASESTGLPGIFLMDLNNDVRRWVSNEPAEKYFQITDINKNTFICREWDFLTDAQKVDGEGELLPIVNVAKLIELRGDTWVNETIGGVSYVAVGGSGEEDPHILRSANSGSEQQEIIPPIFVDVSIIKAKRVDIGTGAIINNLEALWEDTGQSRAWSEIFE